MSEHPADEPCPECAGTGRFCPQCDSEGAFEELHCPVCGTATKPCAYCEGTGLVD